ncbi:MULTISPECIES: helix-turn-helix domain-containing protein [unclassified Rhodanobacter]|jgi:DNA-binding HxlR family transcriptional regulator|uniref:winged helix-turn-helix transcriptional regulator n=1 Tax=unclassified Rhodanobacter TaxID=2621553 RepID=UPI001608AA66|nr:MULTISPECIES: helix-turn-helix domain-containing protein [unclassified Rhodanobacter]MBB6242132.1 DNA-binding HxlR family transcriptional regulator [Rhodanobacter sp. MP1X3]MBB6248944.1 DNA-binding HxlR family transcriptional regulator [Rhodanobacter sp. A1T4]
MSAREKLSENVKPLASRLRQGELLSTDCPSRKVLMHVTSRWGVLVLLVLLDGMHRFSELRRKVGGVSEKMLSQTLQLLEGDGFLQRKSLPVMPPHVEYTLTPLGREVAEHVSGLGEWIEVNLPRIMLARRQGTSKSASRMHASK